MGLTDIGFSAEQERIYTALLEHPWASVDGLADQLYRPAEEIQRQLAGLVELGVVEVDGADENKYVAKNPVTTLGQLIDRKEEELMRDYRRVAETRAQAAELATRFTAAHPSMGQAAVDVETVLGLDDVRERLDELSFYSRTSVLSIQPGGPQSIQAMDASRRLDHRGIRRELTMKVIHEASVLDDPANRAHLQELTYRGVLARVSRKSMSRMVIFDKTVAVLALDPVDSKRGALIVRHLGLVAGFVQLFEHTWDESDEIVWETSDPEMPKALIIDATDRRILELLAAGRTDEVAARELGCSVRTVRRQIARLMQVLGAGSRFEAGVEASRRGWLTDSRS